MPLPISASVPSLLIRRNAFERAGLTRETFDAALQLTADEFRVEGDLIAVGPVYDAGALAAMVEWLEANGLVYFDDFFDLSGNWPEWLRLFAMAAEPGG